MSLVKDVIIFVEGISMGQVQSLKKYNPNLKTLLLRDVKRKEVDLGRNLVCDYVEYVDFYDEFKLAKALSPYQTRLLAITARAEIGVQYFAKVIPHIPYLRTPTPESLHWCLDKYKMRRRIKLSCPQHNPIFTKVNENTKLERQRIIKKVKFPMVIKPANLEASVLVSICYHEEELEKTLGKIFRKLKKEYNKLARDKAPVIIAEEFMDGDMYSIDSYVNSRGKVFHCPIVQIKTGKNIGHDDFYNYLRLTPTNLKKTTVAKAEQAAEAAVHALGLRNSTAHIELMKIEDEWKIIELGARMGGFRHELYDLSCGIDHQLNDILIRIPQVPKIPKKCHGYSAVMRCYPNKEGKISAILGIKYISNLKSVVSVKQKLKVGDRCYYSKNGGRGVLDIVFSSDSRTDLLADIRRVEKIIEIKIGGRSTV